MVRKVHWRRCRCCLNESDFNMKNLSEESEEGIKYSVMYDFLIGIQESVLFEFYLCTKCEKNLISSYLFKKQCVENKKKYYSPDENSGELKTVIKKRTETGIPISSNREEYLKLQDDHKHEKENSENSMRDFLYQLELCHRNKSENQKSGCDENKNNESLSNVDFLNTEEKLIRSYACRRCRLQFNTEVERRQHYIQNHKEKSDRSFICFVCTKKFDNKFEYKKHFTKVHKNQEFFAHKCLSCNIQFNIRKDYTNHIFQIHATNNEMGHGCAVCNTKFKTAIKYKKHCIEIHKAVKICSKCNLLFFNLKEYELHSREHKINNNDKSSTTKLVTENKPFKCSQCGKNYSKILALQQHEKLHIKNMYYKCEYCDKSFFKRKTLNDHIISHAPSWSINRNLSTENISGEGKKNGKNFADKSSYKCKLRQRKTL